MNFFDNIFRGWIVITILVFASIAGSELVRNYKKEPAVILSKNNPLNAKVFEPVGTKILLYFEPINAGSGIILPEMKNKPDGFKRYPKVLAVGPGVTKCKPGDTVLLGNGFAMQTPDVIRDHEDKETTQCITEECWVLAIVK